MRFHLLILFFISFTAFADRVFYVHPHIENSIKERQMAFKTGESEDFILIEGQKNFTGFHPSWEMYENARFRKAWVKTAADIPKEWSLRQSSYSPVRGQLNGDCWAQGAISALELTVNFADKIKREFAVQDVIDCSGFGSASQGGQMSMKHFEKGAVWNADYAYTGRDARCRTDVTRREKTKKTFYLRGTSGRFPTLPEIQSTMLQFGALEVCGASSSLSNGGRQDTIRTGVVDHCYALTGWIDGKKKGWLDATYLEIKNSWGGCDGSTFSNGRCWGDKGYGYYPLAKGDGVNLKGSVITEIQGVEYKAFAPAEPVEFTVENGNVLLKVKVMPTATYSVDDAKAALKSAIDSL